MAKRPARSEPDPETEHHIFQDLGFASLEAYRIWCAESGLQFGYRKSEMQRRQERSLRQKQGAERALRQARILHNPSHAIWRIFGGELDEQSLPDGPLKIIAQACRKQKAAAELRDYLMQIDSSSRLLTSKEATIAVLNLYRYNGEWIRDPSEWKTRSHNMEKQPASLASHLLCEYEPPGFMLSVWYATNRTSRSR